METGRRSSLGYFKLFNVVDFHFTGRGNSK